MIENEVEQMSQDQSARMSSQGIELSMYLQYLGQSMEEFKQSLEPMARVRVKSSLIIEKITEVINPEVTEADYEEEIKTIADTYKISIEDVKKSVGAESSFINDSIRARKTVEYLASKAVKVEPKEPDAEPAEEKKPAKKTAAKKTTAKKAEDAEAPAEEKPKKTAAKKTTAKKAEDAAEAPAEEKPKKTRAKKAKSDEDAAKE